MYTDRTDTHQAKEEMNPLNPCSSVKSVVKLLLLIFDFR